MLQYVRTVSLGRLSQGCSLEKTLGDNLPNETRTHVFPEITTSKRFHSHRVDEQFQHNDREPEPGDLSRIALVRKTRSTL